MRYAQIRSMDISDGEGIGVSLFVQGCKFHCLNCFNPQTWDFNGGKEWTEQVKQTFLKLIDRPYISRISLLGGECLTSQNLEDILELVNEIRISFPNKTIWLYTGYTWEELQEEHNQAKYSPFEPISDEWLTRWEIISKCDVLIDGRYEHDKRDIALRFRGSSNQRVINVQESLKQNQIILYCQ